MEKHLASCGESICCVYREDEDSETLKLDCIDVRNILTRTWPPIESKPGSAGHAKANQEDHGRPTVIHLHRAITQPRRKYAQLSKEPERLSCLLPYYPTPSLAREYNTQLPPRL